GKIKSAPFTPSGSFPRCAGAAKARVSDRLVNGCPFPRAADRKSTRLNSSHVKISYVIFSMHKKIKSAPFSPFGAASLAARGQRKHSFPLASSMAVPSPAQRGKVADRPEGGGF